MAEMPYFARLLHHTGNASMTSEWKPMPRKLLLFPSSTCVRCGEDGVLHAFADGDKDAPLYNVTKSLARCTWLKCQTMPGYFEAPVRYRAPGSGT